MTTVTDIIPEPEKPSEETKVIIDVKGGSVLVTKGNEGVHVGRLQWFCLKWITFSNNLPPELDYLLIQTNQLRKKMPRSF